METTKDLVHTRGMSIKGYCWDKSLLQRMIVRIESVRAKKDLLIIILITILANP